MKLESKDYITLAGILVTLILSAASLWVGIKNSKLTLFINSVTSARIRWIETVRNTIAEFAGLVLHIALTDINEIEERPLIEKVDQLRYKIRLQLNRSERLSKKILDKIDLIARSVDPDEDDSRSDDEIAKQTEKEIESLIELTQDLLKKEWERVKLEANHGNISK